MIDALTAMHATFPEGQSLRYRSSTNNEDLPGFSGAGLYDSKTQKPDETVEDGIDKSLKQVYASMWNFRAFTEREFHRIDHLAAAMGVLVHPNFSDELANGVAVSLNPIVGGVEGYYVNTQLGEDLVTNPEALSVPEEVLLHEPGKYARNYEILTTSNRVDPGELLMSDAQMDQLRGHLGVIHDEFAELYGIEAGEKFAMEIEFKITSENVLSIKQARPWVFSHVEENSQATGKPTVSGTAQVAETLTASTSDIADEDGLANVEFRYQWIRSDGNADTDIQGATESTYELSNADAGKTIKVRVSFTDDAEYEETLTSEPTEAVAARPNSPATGLPAIGGTDRVKETLAADVSGIDDPDGMDNAAFGYQWVRGDGHTDTDIQNATGSTYTLQAEDEGKTVKVRVSFTDDAGNEESLTSAATASVAPVSPVVWSADMSVVDLGNGAIGAVRSALFSNEGGSADLQAKWLWYYTPVRELRLSFTEIVPGAEELTLQIGDVALTLQAGDSSFTWSDLDVDWADGQVIPVRVVRASAADNTPATGLPTISGTAQVGETLTAETTGIADEDGLTNPTYSYKWIRSDNGTDAHIGVQTASTYSLVTADEGKTIKVRVSFTDDGGNEETLTSTATAEIAARPNTPATGLSTISGTAQVGETLTVDTSPIADEDGLDDAVFAYQWLADDANIQGAANSTYTLSDEEVGKAIKVKVSFTDDGSNDETLTSTATTAVAAKPNTPATGEPDITGTAQVGEVLTVDTSNIADQDGLDDVSYSYQWIRSDGGTDTDLVGETASTYTLVSTDEGKTIKVRVTFTDAANNEETLISAATVEVAAKPNSPATGAPTISGTAQVGETLTAEATSIADEDGLDNVSYSYQWIADGTDIDGATGSTYELSNSQEGKTIQVRVSFTDDANNEETLISAATVEVAAKPNSPATGAPTISGTVQVGETLTADTANIADQDGLTNVSYRYQWLAGGTDIDGATGSSHTLTASQQGQTIQVGVTFTDDRNNAEARTSDATAAVAAKPNTPATGLPTISGTAQVGETLTVDTSGIADEDGLNDAVFAYQWLADDANIQGAANSTYTLSDEDVGKAIKVKVSFTDDGSNDETLTSAATAVVAAKPNSPATGAPVITGTAQRDETLTADTSGIADADGLDNATYSYQWIRNDGTNDSDIGGQTGSTYTLVSADEGKTIKVKVSFTDDADNEEMLTSAATAAVAAAPSRLTVSLENAATTHNGSVVFTFEIRFSEEFALSYATLKFRAFDVTGGEVLNAQRMDKPSNIRWLIKVRPDSNGDVTVVLPVTEDCATQGAICTEDGRPLSNRLEMTVTGPRSADQNTEATGAPAIRGTVQAGQTLTADASGIDDADGLTNVAFSYQWLADDADIQDATGSTYTLSDDDVGKVIKVKATFTDNAGNEESLTSKATAEVAARPNSPATGAPTISGTAQAGETLTADTSGITDADGLTNVSYSYQWLAEDADIAGETASTYTLSDDDVGKVIKVKATFTDNAGNEESLTSEATAEVTARPNSPATGAPTISGTAQAGETLTADTSGITDADGLTNVTFSYQWLADNSDIGGETASTYAVSDDDVGKAISVRVTFTDDRDNEESLTSEATAEVTARPNSPATGAPAISGTVQAGQTLTADTSGITDADGLTNVTFSYQWLADSSYIGGETASTYAVSDDDVGKAISVRVTFTDDRDNEESLTSEATAEVTARPDSPDTEAPPSDTGTTVEITVGDTVAGDIAEASEVDWFKVRLLASETYRIDMRGAWGGGWVEVDGKIVWVSAGTLEDPKLLGVFGEDNALVPGTDEEESGNDRGEYSEGKNSRITSFSPPADGYYYIAAAAEGAWTGTYELTVTVVTDE